MAKYGASSANSGPAPFEKAMDAVWQRAMTAEYNSGTVGATSASPDFVLASGVVVTADNIRSAIVQLDATARTIDTAVDACTSLDPLTRAQWKTFYAGYKLFADTNRDIGFFTFGLPNLGDQVVSYEGQMDSWYKLIAQKCALGSPAPGTPHNPPPPPGALSTGTKVLIGMGIGLAALVILSPVLTSFAATRRSKE